MVRQPLARVPQGLPHCRRPAGNTRHSRLNGLTRGGRNTKFHIVCDSLGRTVQMFLSAGQISNCTARVALLSVMPQAKVLLADRGHDTDSVRNTLIAKAITPCSPARKNRKVEIGHDAVLCKKKRHKVETCLVASRTGAGSPCALTDAPTFSCPHAYRQQSSCSGHES